MKLYRQRPVVVEAEMYDGTHASATKIVEWAQGRATLETHKGEHRLWIDGYITPRPGDYVVREAFGVFGVYSPRDFRADYEPVLEL